MSDKGTRAIQETWANLGVSVRTRIGAYGTGSACTIDVIISKKPSMSTGSNETPINRR